MQVLKLTTDPESHADSHYGTITDDNKKHNHNHHHNRDKSGRSSKNS
jgi:hypothetical protein